MHADELKPQTTISKRCDERGARSVFPMGLKFRISSVQNSPLYSASLVCAQVYFEILRLQERPAARIRYLPSFMGITREKLPIYELLRRIGVTPADPYDFDITLNAVKFGYLFSNADLSNEKSANFT